jgi:hypothetical protein
MDLVEQLLPVRADRSGSPEVLIVRGYRFLHRSRRWAPHDCCLLILAGRENALDELHIDEGHSMTSLAVGRVPPALLERGLVALALGA